MKIKNTDTNIINNTCSCPICNTDRHINKIRFTETLTADTREISSLYRCRKCSGHVIIKMSSNIDGEILSYVLMYKKPSAGIDIYDY